MVNIVIIVGEDIGTGELESIEPVNPKRQHVLERAGELYQQTSRQVAGRKEALVAPVKEFEEKYKERKREMNRYEYQELLQKRKEQAEEEKFKKLKQEMQKKKPENKLLRSLYGTVGDSGKPPRVGFRPGRPMAPMRRPAPTRYAQERPSMTPQGETLGSLLSRGPGGSGSGGLSAALSQGASSSGGLSSMLGSFGSGSGGGLSALLDQKKRQI